MSRAYTTYITNVENNILKDVDIENEPITLSDKVWRAIAALSMLSIIVGDAVLIAALMFYK